MKNIPFVWTIGMIVTTPFWAYLLLPLFISAIFSPPGTKSDLARKERELPPKTSQQYINRAYFLRETSSATKQDIYKALDDCQMAEKLARKEKKGRYSVTLLCQGLAHAYLGDGTLARKLVAQGVAEERQSGRQELADLYQPLYKKWIERIEAKPPIPDSPSLER